MIRSSASLQGLLRGAGQCVLNQHQLLHQRHPSALDTLLEDVAGPKAVEQGPLRPWLELMVRAYWACGRQARTGITHHDLQAALAAFATSVWALEILDDLVDGDEPEAGRQAGNVAMALMAEGMGLLQQVTAPLNEHLIGYWSAMWADCAAAQALDVALSTEPTVTVAQALRVAEGSGLVTQWAVLAGALLAGASATLRAPLASFGVCLGTADKLLHDLHTLWPESAPARDLGRTPCSLALALAREQRITVDAAPGTVDDSLRHRLLRAGILHCTWAYADQYRLQAASALDLFARAGGDAVPLARVLALPPELRAIQAQDAKLQALDDSL